MALPFFNLSFIYLLLWLVNFPSWLENIERVSTFQKGKKPFSFVDDLLFLTDLILASVRFGGMFQMYPKEVLSHVCLC